MWGETLERNHAGRVLFYINVLIYFIWPLSNTLISELGKSFLSVKKKSTQVILLNIQYSMVRQFLGSRKHQ